MKMYRDQRLLYGLLGICLLLLLAACGSTAVANPVSAPTSTTKPGPTPPFLVTAPPVPTQAPKLTVTFGCKTGVKEGFFADQSHAFACVRTLPGASLTISVSYCNGKSDQSSSLQGTFTADSTGYYEWDWKPQAPCQNGPAYWSGKATVTARLNGQTASGESVFQAD
jgi:hypothetical protein